MKKIGIIICGRYQNCGGGKCFRAASEHAGGFSIYPLDEEIQIVGYSQCGGCPGGNVEYVPAEMIKTVPKQFTWQQDWLLGILHALESRPSKNSWENTITFRLWSVRTLFHRSIFLITKKCHFGENR